ncbi:MAG: acyl-CoA dehydrogenase [Calditrichaeota bacterium]|nr:acyl-CoA dehydrogenase [Calditrichota bacterium]MCB9367779.1 acyl-CoA dehydrogenase [Calditrichota bacterium]
MSLGDRLPLTEEQKMLRDMVRDFAENKIKPIAAEIDETERFPEEIFAEMGELGLMGIPYPEEYGGAGMDYTSYALAIEEIAKVCGSTALGLAAHISLGCGPIYLFGTEEQKKKYLPDLCAGKHMGGFGLTEPQAGSDAGATKTTCLDQGDHYLLNGTKVYCTNGSYSKTYVVSALTEKDKGTRGISCFIVERDWDGFAVGKKERKLGVRGSDTVVLHFNDVKVPKANLLGRPGEGFKQMLATLDGGRISIGSMSLGLAEGAYIETLKYVTGRKAFDQRIADFQATQFKLADMLVQIEAARHMIFDAAKKKDAGEDFSREAAMAKLYASEVGARVTSQAIQLHGGYGYVREYPVERMFRDNKLTEIGEGTSEIQRLVIARALLKEWDQATA